MAVHEVFSSRRFVTVVMAVLALTVVGCSSTTNTTSADGTTTIASSSLTYPAGKEQVCSARDQLKLSITEVARPSLLIGGKDAITAALDKVQSDLDTFRAATKETYQPQVDAVKAALRDLRAAVGDLGNGSLSQNLQTVGSDITKLGTATDDLFTTLKTTCGS
jgi:hypothetical protein